MKNFKKVGIVSVLATGLVLSMSFSAFATENKKETEEENVYTSISEKVNSGQLTDMYVISDDGLNVRLSPSMDAKIITALAYGEKVEKIEDTKDKKWALVWYEDKVRFMYNEFLSEEKPADAEIIEYEVGTAELYLPNDNGTYDLVWQESSGEEINEVIETATEENAVVNNPQAETTSAIYSPSDFKFKGVINDSGYRWTWYSENVLPGGGLNIPGRYTDEQGYVRDGSGYICLASSDLEKGTVVSTPFGGEGKVYDTGCASGTLDVYTGW